MVIFLLQIDSPMRSRSPAKGRGGLHTQHQRRNSYDLEFEHNTTTNKHFNGRVEFKAESEYS
ncbi:hypothetical protein SESBI_19626 [Sesbania bispinosa]|nr:hypothetical protein SESBI_19626 [Sesbania bispinosa]